MNYLTIDELQDILIARDIVWLKDDINNDSYTFIVDLLTGEYEPYGKKTEEEIIEYINDIFMDFSDDLAYQQRDMFTASDLSHIYDRYKDGVLMYQVLHGINPEHPILKYYTFKRGR